MVVQFGVKPPDATLAVEGLSGGNQQKVIIGRWLSTDARVLVLEEPTAGVDVGAKREIYELIDQLARQDKAILMISSDLPEAIGTSDRVLVMHQGQIAADLRSSETTEEEVMSYATGTADKEPQP